MLFRSDSQNRTLSAASSGLLLYSRFRIIPLNFIFHVVGILSELDRMFPVDLAFKIQLNNSLIHGDHTQFPVGLHDAGQLVGFALTDQVADRMIGMHDLKSCHTVLAVRCRDQLLGYDCFQCVGQLDTDLLLLMWWEDIDHTVYGAGCTTRGAALATRAKALLLCCQPSQ